MCAGRQGGASFNETCFNSSANSKRFRFSSDVRAEYDSEASEVGDRVHVAYLFEGVEEGEPYVVEQQLYGTVQDGKIAQADLLCSGFRPRQAE